MPVVTTQLCVVGGGLGGMIAAAHAAEQGIRVVLLERSAEREYPCNSRLTGGVFHVCVTDIQSDPEKLEQAILHATGGAAHAALARAIAQDTRRAVKWLQAKGARFIRGSMEPHQNFVLAPPALHRQGLDWKGRGGDVTLRLLESALLKDGGTVLRGYRATSLKVEAGECCGVSGEVEGEPFEINAEFVVIADGGFQNDNELMKAHITPEPGAVLQRNAGASHGDGLRMARAVGAKISDLRGFYGHVQHREALKNSQLWPYPWMDDIVTASILVDERGSRFVDEGRGGVYCANAIASLENPQGAWVIYDQATWDTAGKARFLPPNPHLEKAGGRIVRAASVPALANALGMESETLGKTIESYNAAVSSSTADRLTPSRSSRVRAPASISMPFYAIPVVAGVTNTMGGIAIDEWGQAMHEDGRPFAGLFAVGGASGGLEGGQSVGYVGGLAKASVTGLRAAERIASAVDSR